METPTESTVEQPQRGLSPAWVAAGVIGLIVLGLLGYALVGVSSDPPQIGGPVPDFQLTALDGSPMNLSEQQGKPVVVNFLAAGGTPTGKEVDHDWLAYQDRGVQFFGIAYKDADSKAQAFLDEFDVSYPSTVDPSNRTARAYGLTGVPETFVIDQQGLLVRHFLGPISQTQLSQELDTLLP